MQIFAEFMKFDFLLEPWVVQILTIIFIALIAAFFAKYSLNYIEKASQKTYNKWDDALILAARAPISVAIWIVAAKFSLEIVDKNIDFMESGTANTMARIAVILCFMWFLLRAAKFVAQHTINSGKIIGKEVDNATVDALLKLAKLVIIVITVLIVMQDLGVNISGILAAGGVGGLVLGLAAKDMLANFFGGMTIYLDKPFVVGDWIRSPDKQIEGNVEYIGWRQTRIRGFNKNPIYVTNSIFTTIIVENPSRMSHRRIKETIGLHYKDIGKIEAITQEIENMLKNHNEIDQESNVYANFNSFGNSSLEFTVNALMKNTDLVHFNKVKQEILLKIDKIIKKYDAEIAFSTQTLYINNN